MHENTKEVCERLLKSLPEQFQTYFKDKIRKEIEAEQKENEENPFSGISEEEKTKIFDQVAKDVLG